MNTKQSPKLQKSIKTATSKFSSKTSGLHKSLANELKRADAQHNDLLIAFAQRQSKRSSIAQATVTTRVAAAKADLERVKLEQGPLLNCGNSHLETVAQNIIKFAEGQVALVETLGRADSGLNQRLDDIDLELLKWIEELAQASIDAIESDKARKRAINIINGGLIIGGLATVPFVPGISALLASILLAKQWIEEESDSDSDSDTHRIERALALLKYVNAIMKAWLDIL